MAFIREYRVAPVLVAKTWNNYVGLNYRAELKGSADLSLNPEAFNGQSISLETRNCTAGAGYYTINFGYDNNNPDDILDKIKRMAASGGATPPPSHPDEFGDSTLTSGNRIIFKVKSTYDSGDAANGHLSYIKVISATGGVDTLLGIEVDQYAQGKEPNYDQSDIPGLATNGLQAYHPADPVFYRIDNRPFINLIDNDRILNEEIEKIWTGYDPTTGSAYSRTFVGAEGQDINFKFYGNDVYTFSQPVAAGTPYGLRYGFTYVPATGVITFSVGGAGEPAAWAGTELNSVSDRDYFVDYSGNRWKIYGKTANSVTIKKDLTNGTAAGNFNNTPLVRSTATTYTFPGGTPPPYITATLVDTTKNFTALGVVALQHYIVTDNGAKLVVSLIKTISTTTNPNDTITFDTIDNPFPAVGGPPPVLWYTITTNLAGSTTDDCLNAAYGGYIEQKPGRLNVYNDLKIMGDIYLEGGIWSETITELFVEDRDIHLNINETGAGVGGGTGTSGIYVDRGSLPDARFWFDEPLQTWTANPSFPFLGQFGFYTPFWGGGGAYKYGYHFWDGAGTVPSKTILGTSTVLYYDNFSTTPRFVFEKAGDVTNAIVEAGHLVSTAQRVYFSNGHQSSLAAVAYIGVTNPGVYDFYTTAGTTAGSYVNTGYLRTEQGYIYTAAGTTSYIRNNSGTYEFYNASILADIKISDQIFFDASSKTGQLSWDASGVGNTLSWIGQTGTLAGSYLQSGTVIARGQITAGPPAGSAAVHFGDYSYGHYIAFNAATSTYNFWAGGIGGAGNLNINDLNMAGDLRVSGGDVYLEASPGNARLNYFGTTAYATNGLFRIFGTAGASVQAGTMLSAGRLYASDRYVWFGDPNVAGTPFLYHSTGGVGTGIYEFYDNNLSHGGKIYCDKIDTAWFNYPGWQPCVTLYNPLGAASGGTLVLRDNTNNIAKYIQAVPDGANSKLVFLNSGGGVMAVMTNGNALGVGSTIESGGYYYCGGARIYFGSSASNDYINYNDAVGTKAFQFYSDGTAWTANIEAGFVKSQNGMEFYTNTATRPGRIMDVFHGYYSPVPGAPGNVPRVHGTGDGTVSKTGVGTFVVSGLNFSSYVVSALATGANYYCAVTSVGVGTFTIGVYNQAGAAADPAGLMIRAIKSE